VVDGSAVGIPPLKTLFFHAFDTAWVLSCGFCATAHVTGLALAVANLGSLVSLVLTPEDTLSQVAIRASYSQE
jgi:hypothetical protein